jgi:hypothetical protein
MDRTTHPFAPEEVMAYLDGELSPERAAAAAAHLEQCTECRTLAADLRGVSRQLAAWQVQAPADTMTESAVRAAAAPLYAMETPKPGKRAEEQPARKRRGMRLLLWGGVFATATLLLLAISAPNLLRSRSSSGRWMDESAYRSPGAASPVAEAPSRSSPDDLARTYAPSNFDGARSEASGAMSKGGAAAGQSPAEKSGPMIVRRASLAILTKEFQAARATLENLVRAHQGYFGQLGVSAPANAGRTLVATVRVPAAQLDPMLAELRQLGRVEQESQTADDVTRQHADLAARLANARETEKRLIEILRERTGKVGDVLDVEREIASVRGQIEQMDAERKTLENRVPYASIELRLTEEYKQSLETPAPSLSTRIHNAAVEGFRSAADLVIGLLLLVLNAGPTLLLLAALFAWPMWQVVRWIRRRLLAAATPSAAS